MSMECWSDDCMLLLATRMESREMLGVMPPQGMC